LTRLKSRADDIEDREITRATERRKTSQVVEVLETPPVIASAHCPTRKKNHFRKKSNTEEYDSDSE